MSLFISLSSTSKIFGILVSPSPGNSGSGCLTACLTLCYIRKGDGIGVRDSGRTSEPVLFYKNCKAVPLDRLDEIIGGAQVQAPGLVVHDGNHNHRNFRQFRITLEPIQNGPSIAFRHDYIEGNKKRANLLCKAQAFVSILGSHHMEIQI